MRYIYIKLFLFCFFLSPSCYGTSSPWVKAEVNEVNILDLRITSSTEGVGELKTIPASLEVITQPGWKIYWRNPGDAGLPPEIINQNSVNIENIEILWPVPKRFKMFDIENFGYEGRIIFPLLLTVLEVGNEIILDSEVDILACKEICVPISEKIHLKIPVAESKPSVFARSRAQFLSLVPKKNLLKNNFLGELFLDGQSLVFRNSSVHDLDYDIIIEFEGFVGFGKPFKNGKDIRVPIQNNFSPLKLINNEVKITYVSANRIFEENRIVKPQSLIDLTSINFLDLMFFIPTALLAGLILNFMPCVLPVLGLKLGKVFSQANQSNAEIRFGFLMTALGIIFSFVSLSIILIFLRTVGVSISWGMQFQNGWFLLIMSIIILVFALNLFGVFEFRLSQSLTNKFPRNQTGYFGDFVAGIIATILSTPCSAPIVGTAITFAFSQSNIFMFTIFLFMGLGLAFPWIMVALFPNSLNLLPQKGFWMIYMKRILGVGLVITSVWLLTIYFSAYKDNDVNFENHIIDWEPGITSELVNKGYVVFLDFTAEWCLTCKVNKKILDNNDEFQQLLSSGKVKFVQADWTLPDERILNLLVTFGKFGIPFNIIFGPSKLNGIILPEILIVKNILLAIKEAS